MFVVIVAAVLFLIALSVNRIKPLNSIFLFLIMVFLALLLGLVKGDPDYENYRRIYEGHKKVSEMGYMYLCRICYGVGISYPAFRVLLAFCGLGLFWRSLNMLQIKNNYFWLLYMIFPFFLDAVQLRNFITCAVVCYALVLLSQDVKFKYIKYILLVLLAVTFHTIAVVYLILPLAIFLRKHLMLKQLYKILIVAVVLITLNREWFDYIFDYAVHIVGQWNEQVFYYDTVMTRRGYLYYWAVQLLMLFFLCYLQGFRLRGKTKLRILQEEKDASLSAKYFPEFIIWVDIVMLVYLPIYIMRVEYFRIYRNIMPLNYMAILLLLKEKDISKIKKRTTVIVFAVIMVFIFYVEYIRSDLMQNVVWNLFQNSWLNIVQ